MVERSFFLVRTNPALTGNIKIVIDSKYKLYLESFAINKTLSQQRFQHFKIEKDEYWKELLAFFFQDIESSSIFDVKFNNDVSEVYDDYSQQFDDTYDSGAFFTQDTYYTEEYEYLAPLYLKSTKLPKNFIILRVDGPGSLTQDSSANNFRSQIVDQWKFITSIDLSENSDLGFWIKNNFISDDDFPKFPLFINHNDDLTEITGVDTNSGGWIKKYINLKEIQSKNTPIFKNEEYFTKLWEDNNLIYPHILNLKFLFDDTPATPTSLRKWSINRYVGFYIDDSPVSMSVSPYQPFELNKNDINILQNLSEVEVSQIPYIKDNKFVREIKGRLYSFDPIKKGWDNSTVYWVEWVGKYYRLERIVNPDANTISIDSIIGDFIYRIISDTLIECTVIQTNVDSGIQLDRKIGNNIIDTYIIPSPGKVDDSILKQFKKVLIDEISTGKNKITISNQIKINNSIGQNIIQNVNTTFTFLKRLYNIVEVDGQSQLLFRIDLLSDINNNLFSIPNFNDADLFLININGSQHVIKQYSSSTPNFGNIYYIQTDWAIDVSEKKITSWINNGNISNDPLYYKNLNIDTINQDNTPPSFDITRVKFSDIKDFDFDRIETDYARYEYEKSFENSSSLEPKLYAKEYRNNVVKVRTLNNDIARRLPILDLNNRPYNIREQLGDLNPFTQQPYTESDLYRTDFDGSSWSIFNGTVDGTNWSSYNNRDVQLKRKYYREENYIWRVTDDLEQIHETNFITNSDPSVLEESLTWGLNNKQEVSDPKQTLTPIKSKNDPNTSLDQNYIPVSSEYVASDELWEIRSATLTDIWRKNPSICKWGFLNSIGLHDYPYRLNYSLDMAGIYNKEPNIYSGVNVPQRKNLDLDYFYRFGLDNPSNYKFYSLHLKENSFNIEKYISADYDYFEYIFKSDQVTTDGVDLTKKYSMFVSANSFNDPYTVFRGIKYTLSDVDTILHNTEDSLNSTLIDDIITKVNTNYEDYKFSIIFSKKLNGNGNNNSGYDIYLNDLWKNVIIHLYIDTQDTIQINDSTTLTTFNAETCEIDLWYQDDVEKQEINPTRWDNTGFKVNNSLIGRPRDFMLQNFLFTLNNFNYNPPEGKNNINFIHIYNDGRVSNPMTYQNTDFIIKFSLPDETLVMENAFKASPLNVEIDVNNTLLNRIILDDDTNSLSNNSQFTSDGFRVGSIPDLNSYNNYPIGREIIGGSDKRQYWELEDDTDPSIFRYSGPYIPIFRDIPLFRPLGFIALSTIISDQGVGIPTLKDSGNWKFYDPNSDTTLPNLLNFGTIKELTYSKCNPTSNILKLQSTAGESIYPMVDEYGYEFDSKYLFSANWEPGFYSLSRRVEVQPNKYPSLAGYTIVYDGVKDFLRIPDALKFNLDRHYIDDVNFNNGIINEPEGERSSISQTFTNIGATEQRTFDFKLLAYQRYKISFTFFNVKGNPNGLSYSLSLINDPTDPNQNDTKYLITGTANTITNGSTHSIISHTDTYTPNSHTGAFGHLFTFNSSTIVVPQFLPKNYVYDDIINVRLTLNLAYASSFIDPTSSIDVTPAKFDMDFTLSTPKNILNINIGGTNGTGGIVYDNDFTNVWGGYLKLDTEIGDVHNFPFRVKEKENYKNYSILTSNLNSSTYSDLVTRGFKVTTGGTNGTSTFSYDGNILNNKNNPLISISNSTQFRFEPERWTNVNDGNSIAYIGLKNGDSTINPEYTLQWFNDLPQPKVYTQTTPIFKFEPEISRRKNNKFLQSSTRRIEQFIPGVINTDKNYYFKPDPFIPKQPSVSDLLDQENKNREEVRRNPFFQPPSTIQQLTDQQSKVASDNETKKKLSKSTYVQPLGKFSFVPGSNFQPVPLPPIPSLVNDTNQTVLRNDQIVDSINFNIVPDNGDKISVSVDSRYPNSNIPFTMAQIIGLINNIITPNYEASEVNVNDIFPTSTFTSHFKTFKIKSRNTGSYFNFNVELTGSNLDIIPTSTIKATLETTVSEKFTKTSIKEGVERLSGYMNGFTVEFWVRIDGWTKDYETILYKGLDSLGDPWVNSALGINSFTYIIGKNGKDDALSFRTSHHKLNGTYETHNLVAKTLINDGNWHHVACVMNTIERQKSIYIDGKLDILTSDFLTPSYPANSIQLIINNLIGIFLDNRARFLPKSEDINKFPDFQTLANKIRNNFTDSKTKYWFDVIRGYRSMTYWDKYYQLQQLGTTIDVAFKEFQNNFIALDYYLPVDLNTNWNILIASDSTLALGRRNFKGALDELRIWNYNRTSDQIKGTYKFISKPNSYLDPLKSLVAYYRFDEGKGLTSIKDLMEGKMIKDMYRWSKVNNTVSNDGFKEKSIIDVNFFQFDQSFYNGANINVDTSTLNWIVSNAEIDGFSDERYVSEPPPPSTKETITVVEKPTFKKSEFMSIKNSKSNVDLQNQINNTNLPNSTHYKETWLQKAIDSGRSSVGKVISFLESEKIVQPKKIIESISSAPAKWVGVVTSLFKKKRK